MWTTTAAAAAASPEDGVAAPGVVEVLVPVEAAEAGVEPGAGAGREDGLRKGRREGWCGRMNCFVCEGRELASVDMLGLSKGY